MTPAAFPDIPFVGLRPFESLESLLFFGRQEQTAALLQRLHHHGFVAVVGSSGSGKSSLVRAGLMPKLRGGFLVEDRDRWHMAVMKPGHAPLANLAAALHPLLPGDEDGPPNADALHEALEEGGADAMLNALAPLFKDGDANLLLVVDQFEEIFRFGGQAGAQTEAADFVALMLALAEQHERPVYVVMTMRSDFLGDCDVFYGLPEALNRSQYLVPRLTRGQLRSAIQGPIRLFGGTVNRTLVDRLLNDLGDDRDQLPVIQHALMRTWQVWEQDGDGPIDHVHYEKAGTLHKALSLHADEALAGMTDQDKQITEALFRALTDTDDGNRQIRRPALLSEVAAMAGAEPEQIRAIIETFQSDGRSFLVLSNDNDPLIDISHESLIRQWITLHDWVDDEARSAHMYRRLADRTEDHEAGTEGVLTDPQLQLALNWRNEDQPTAPWARRYDPDPAHPRFDRAMAYLEKSENEREKKARRERTIMMTLGVITLIALGATIIALVSYINANNQTRLADSARLAWLAINLQDSHFSRAQLLSVEGFETADTYAARNGLLKALQHHYVGEVDFIFRGHQDDVLSVAFSPDGKTLASGSRDNTVILWDVATRQALGEPLTGHQDAVWSATFSPDGKTLASASEDNTVRLWDVATRQALGQPLQGHKSVVLSVAFSPDGKTLASGSTDNTVILWDIATRQALGEPLAGHQSFVYSVAFSPDGKTLASASEDNTVRLWDVATRQALGEPLTGHQSVVYSVAFNPDGKTLASASEDNTVILWDVATRQALGEPLTGHQSFVYSVAFSPDGKTLASASEDNTVILWDVATRQALGQPLTGHHSDVWSVAFNPDGKTLASASADNTVILWDVATRQTLGQPLQGHQDAVRSVAFSPDSKILASGSWDHTIMLWDVATRQILGELLRGHQSFVYSVAFSPDGKTLASASEENTVILWDVATRQALSEPLTGHQDAVWSVAFSPDGKTLASASEDNTVILWDIATRQALGEPLRGHQDAVYSVAFSPDGKTLASASEDNTVILWDIATRQTLGELLQGHQDAVYSVAFSPDGKTLASGSFDNTIMLWDVATRQALGQPLTEHQNTVWSVAFSPDGKTLASASADRTVLLWDVATRQILGEPLRGHQDAVKSVAFSLDGKTLASGSEDNTILLWDVAIEAWKTLACRRAKRNLTQIEWTQYIGEDEAYRRTCPDLPPGD